MRPGFTFAVLLGALVLLAPLVEATNYGPQRGFTLIGAPISGTEDPTVAWHAREYSAPNNPGTNLTLSEALTAPGIYVYAIDELDTYREFPHDRMTLVNPGSGSAQHWYYEFAVPAETSFRTFGACVHHALNATPTAIDTTYMVQCATLSGPEVYGLWESREHANATWEAQSHANDTWEPAARAVAVRDAMNVTSAATYEGQLHANDTWCPLPTCGIDTSLFEGRAHANATRDEINATAAATFEGQAHANATWCPIASCSGGGDAVGNLWFNQTFLANATFENVTAGNVTLQSAAQIETSADPYVPVIFWGGLFLLFIYYRAWMPVITSLMALLNALLPEPIWNLAAGVMLVSISVIIHAIVTGGLMPRIFGKRDS